MLKEVKFYIKQHIENKHYIWKLAVSSAKKDTYKTTLGIYWNLVRDIVFFIAYGFFMVVVRNSSSTIEGMPLLVYLFTGLVAWYMINDNLTVGVRVIDKNKNIFKKISFPILIIPTFETIALYLKRMLTLVLLFFLLGIIMLTTDFRLDFNILGFIYAVLASFIFGLSYNLFMSGFYTLSKDFAELYRALTRIMIYFVPVFWSSYQDISGEGILSKLLRYNPPVHLINSFRRAIVLGEIPASTDMLVFLIITATLFMMGCYIQYRLQKIYADLI